MERYTLLTSREAPLSVVNFEIFSNAGHHNMDPLLFFPTTNTSDKAWMSSLFEEHM